MPKRGRHRRPGGRVTSNGTRPLSSGGSRPSVSRGASRPAFGGVREPSLIADVRRALRSGEPLDVLALVSGVLAAVDERRRRPSDRVTAGLGRSAPGPAGRPDGVSLGTLVRSFAEVDGPETTALLAVIAQMSDDELVRERARRELAVRAGRLQRLPEWVRRLGDSAALVGVEMVHVLGDGDNVIVGVRVPPRHDLSVVVYIDHNLGTAIKEAFVVPEYIESLTRRMVDTVDDPDMTWRALRVADAGARISEALEQWAITYPPPETDTWPACRPLVEWVLRLVPDGGQGYERPEWTAAERAELTRRFLASPFGTRHRTAERRSLVDSILWFGTDYGPGDPLRWSPPAVEILLLDWVPGKILAPADELAQVPDVLRDVIRFSHAERGIRPALTDETLDAVDGWEPAYQGLIGGGRPGLDAFDLGDRPVAELMLDSLADEVGGRDELMALDVAPLPDEDVDWDRVADDLRPGVREVAELCDRWCESVTGPSAGEYRTACRRFLTAVAAGDPNVFRRRAKAPSAAAAVCWAVGSANRLFDPRHGGLLVKDLAAHFGVSGAPSSRGRTFLQAAGFDAEGTGPVVLDARYLVSAYRRSLAERRDRHLTDDL